MDRFFQRIIFFEFQTGEKHLIRECTASSISTSKNTK